MIAQVVTTGRVIATGPRWNRIVLASGEAAITRSSAPRATRASAPAESRRKAASSGSAPSPAAKPRKTMAPATRPSVRAAGTSRPRAGGIEIDGPPQRREISQARRRSPQRRSQGECSGRSKRGVGHSRYILFQASQQPSGEAGDEQTQRPENPRAERPVEPAAGENADQRRGHDGPAERADHRQVLSDRPLPLALPAFPPPAPQPDRIVEALGVVGRLVRAPAASRL